MTRRKALGPWLKLYGDVVERKAAYTDTQFRALIEAWAWALRGTPRGSLPSRRNVGARLGVDNVDFLFAEGDLVETADGVLVEGWDVYQAGVLSTGRGAKADSGDVVEHLANSSTTVHELSANVVPLPLPSTSSESPTEKEPSSYPARGSDVDALDRYYELTGSRPWGRRIGSWIRELEDAHGIVNVRAALEVEATSGLDKLVDRAAARLAKQADRVAQEAVRAVEKQRRAPKPEDAAMRAALEATGRYGPRVSGLTKVGDMLESLQDGQARKGPALTGDKGSDTVRKNGEVNGSSGLKLTPSLPIAEPGVAETAVRMNGATEAPKPKESRA